MKWIGYLFSSIWRLWFLIVFMLVFIAFMPLLFFFTAIVKNHNVSNYIAHAFKMGKNFVTKIVNVNHVSIQSITQPEANRWPKYSLVIQTPLKRSSSILWTQSSQKISKVADVKNLTASKIIVSVGPLGFLAQKNASV